MEWITLNIFEDDVEKRVDSICKKLFPTLSYKNIITLIRKKLITINKQKTIFNQHVLQGDVLYIAKFLESKLVDTTHEKNNFSAAVSARLNAIDSQVIYNQEGLIVFNKNIEQNIFGKTSISTYLQQYKKPSLSFTPAPCHRLDTNTSGILMCATSAAVAREVTLLHKHCKIHKVYLGLLQKPASNTTLTHTLYRDVNKKKTVLLPSSHEDTPPSNLKLLGEATLHMHSTNPIHVESQKVYPTCIILGDSGGKTHQIRAQCAYNEMPLLNDIKYAPSSTVKKELIYYLHSAIVIIEQMEDSVLPLPKVLHVPIPTRWFSNLADGDYEALLRLDNTLLNLASYWERKFFDTNCSDFSVNTMALYTSLLGGLIG